MGVTPPNTTLRVPSTTHLGELWRDLGKHRLPAGPVRVLQHNNTQSSQSMAFITHQLQVEMYARHGKIFWKVITF